MSYKLITITAFIVFLVSALFFGFTGKLVAEKITCKSFKTQLSAQEHYQRSLDRDGDGIACENLPKYYKR